AAGGLDDADVLVPADQRVREAPLVRGAGVLHRLAAERVLVGAAHPGEPHAQNDRAGLRRGNLEALHADLAGRRHHGGPHGHRVTSSTRTQRRSAAARSIASHTAWTRAPWSRSGSHPPSGQRESSSAAWFTKLTP